MTRFIKMNRNRQVKLPSVFVSKLNLGEDSYFNVELNGNHIVLTPIDLVEQVFSEEDLDLVEETYQKEKSLAKAVTSKTKSVSS